MTRIELLPAIANLYHYSILKYDIYKDMVCFRLSVFHLSTPIITSTSLPLFETVPFISVAKSVTLMAPVCFIVGIVNLSISY